MRLIVAGEAGKVANWIQRVSVRNPARATLLWARIAEFCVPRLQTVALTGPDGESLPAPSFAFTMPNGGPGTNSSVETSGDGGGDEPSVPLPAALPAPIAASAQDQLLRLRIAAPVQPDEATREPTADRAAVDPARLARIADPEEFVHPDVIAAADAYERNAHARRPQAMPPAAVAELVRERRARRAAQARSAAIDASFEVIPTPTAPPPASGTSLATWAQLAGDGDPTRKQQKPSRGRR
ncbi:MAG: hypothetical protein WAN26_03425 [Steroidobacteraceae bacterium]